MTDAATITNAKPEGMATLVEVAGLRMRYGGLVVLDGVDFRVERGEVVVVLGPNGAGKTTMIEILEGFRARSAGSVTVLGVDPASASQHWRADVGIVLQSWRDHARWTPRRLLDHLGRYYQPYATTQRPRPWPADEVIDLVGLGSQVDQKIGTLSGGQRRRLDVAVGIVGGPQLLFLDEPTAGFDPEARRQFHEIIGHLTQSDGMTVLLTTHDLDEAAKLADRILILAGGRIVADGNPAELARRVAADAEVSWRRDGVMHSHATPEPEEFVRRLLADHDDVTDLDVRRNSLEDTYLTLVRHHEAGPHVPAPTALAYPELARRETSL